MNSILDGPLFIGICTLTILALLSTIVVGTKWSKKGKVIRMKLRSHARHAWLASAPVAGFGGWKLANVAGSG